MPRADRPPLDSRADAGLQECVTGASLLDPRPSHDGIHDAREGATPPALPRLSGACGYRVAVGASLSSLRTSLTPSVCCAAACAAVETSGDGTVPVSVTTPATVST